MTFAGLVHRPTPLRLLAGLAALPAEAEVEFTNLRDLLDSLDDNFSCHPTLLEKAGYVSFCKTFVVDKPRASTRRTSPGRLLFSEHRTTIQQLLWSEGLHYTRSKDQSGRHKTHDPEGGV